MGLQFRPSGLTIRRTKIKYIIIHHSICQYNIPEAKIDNNKFQTSALISQSIERKIPDINYHFIIEKIKDDYKVIVARPFVYLCDFDDISNDINKSSLHICLLGSYNFKIPENRLYESLSYYLLSPLIKQFSINYSRIYFHCDITTDKKQTCPGDFMDKEKIIMMIRRFVIK